MTALESLLANGTVWVEGSDYVALAADGEVIFLGNVGREADLLSYLAAYPTPSDW